MDRIYPQDSPLSEEEELRARSLWMWLYDNIDPARTYTIGLVGAYLEEKARRAAQRRAAGKIAAKRDGDEGATLTS